MSLETPTRRVLILDGGVSSVLTDKIAPLCLHPTLWSAALMHPEGVPGVEDPRGLVGSVSFELEFLLYFYCVL